MPKLTKPQQHALWRIIQRSTPQTPAEEDFLQHLMDGHRVWLDYLSLRRAVRPTIGMDGAVVVPWAGMWLAIERDGYTHT